MQLNSRLAITVSHSDNSLWPWIASGGVDDESCHQTAHVESAVESIGKGGEVEPGAFVVLERVMRTGQRGLEVG